MAKRNRKSMPPVVTIGIPCANCGHDIRKSFDLMNFGGRMQAVYKSFNIATLQCVDCKEC